MTLNRRSILQHIHTYSTVQLEHIQDSICEAVISGAIGTAWQEVSNAIDAEFDRRMGYLPPFWVLS